MTARAPGGWGHLALRFADVVTSKALSPSERSAAEGWLVSDTERRAFFDQPVADQRHGYGSALVVKAERPDRPDLVRAALLHDVGKRHADLGAIGRVLASVAIRLRLPLTPRWTAYRDHGELAAAELVGAEPIVTDFARHHHGRRPPTIDAEDWAALIRADTARVGR